MRKLSAAHRRHQAAARATAKRERDREAKVPSMPQITMALGYAARQVIAGERAGGRFEGPSKAIVEVAMERLRQGGFVISSVTASRLISATTPDAPITSS